MNASSSYLRSGIVATLALAVLSACASAPKVRVDKDASVNFAAYRTFGWLEVANDKQNNSIMTQRVHAAVSAALQAKGYVFDEKQPSVRVSYVLNVYERPKESGMRIGLGAGGGSGHVGGGVGLSIPVGKRTESAATMTIDFVDPTRKSQVWTGTYEDVLSTKDATDADVERLVTTILAKFP